MTGARVITCSRCGRQRRHAARQLCAPCYEKLRVLGRLGRYERTTAAYDQASLYCECPTSVLARIALFDAVYCATCSRTLRGVAS